MVSVSTFVPPKRKKQSSVTNDKILIFKQPDKRPPSPNIAKEKSGQDNRKKFVAKWDRKQNRWYIFDYVDGTFQAPPLTTREFSDMIDARKLYLPTQREQQYFQENERATRGKFW
jgi:hypothetical protein